MSRSGCTPPPPLTVRHDLTASDALCLTRMHGEIYGREYGWNEDFESYVAGPLSEFARPHEPGERMWIVEEGDRLVGSVAIVRVSDVEAQLRWLLVDPSARGHGLGRYLVDEAVRFSRESGYRKLVLWTVSALSVAARLYLGVGFRLAEEIERDIWGAHLTEQRYELSFDVQIELLEPNEDSMEELVDLLEDAVVDGASVGFILPFDRELGREYWRESFRQAVAGLKAIFVAKLEGRIVGTVILAYPAQQNGACRAEVQRLLVLRSARRRGIGSKLMAALEAAAVEDGRVLLFLNTRTGDPPEELYRRLGYQTVGTIPDFAFNPDGSLNTTTIMYRRIGAG